MMISKFARRLVFSAALLIACCAAGLAQDSGQVLRVSVGYGTMRNTPSVMARLTPEARAEVDRLAAMARAANGEGKYGDALKHLYHAMALMRGAEWTPARALGSAITVKLDRAMLDPGDKLVIRISQMYALDEKVSRLLASFEAFELDQIGADGQGFLQRKGRFALPAVGHRTGDAQDDQHDAEVDD